MMIEDGLVRELFEELESIPTVDAHEHQQTEEQHLKTKMDFYHLFENYCTGDLVAAGATPEQMKLWSDREQPVQKRWESFKPYLSAIRTGSYARSPLLVVRDVLGLDDLTDDAYEEVGKKLQEMNTPGLYDRLLNERCNICACIQCWCLGQEGPDYFFHLAPGPELVDVFDQQRLQNLSEKHDRPVHTLDDVLECMTAAVQQWADNPKVVGIKSAHAYVRSIGFQKTLRSDAERIFNRILTNETHTLSLHEAVPLQDFLMFELVARAEAVGLPMVFHTGIQAGNYNRISNANPLLLQHLLEEFPRAKFDLFHGGMPWVREIALLAKYFPGVHLNMAWMHIINPVQARSALSEWLEMVPNTKIFGFGGNYNWVDVVYGHVTIARRNIAMVLAEKIREGAYNREEASMVAQRLMFENPNNFYGLGLE